MKILRQVAIAAIIAGLITGLVVFSAFLWTANDKAEHKPGAGGKNAGSPAASGSGGSVRFKFEQTDFGSKVIAEPSGSSKKR